MVEINLKRCLNCDFRQNFLALSNLNLLKDGKSLMVQKGVHQNTPSASCTSERAQPHVPLSSNEKRGISGVRRVHSEDFFLPRRKSKR
jgi:hypothetical protein